MRKESLLAGGSIAALLLCGCAHADRARPAPNALECRPGTLVQESGPIWDPEDAEEKCAAVCGGLDGAWNRTWRTTIPREASVCGCDVCCGDVEAGPIFDQRDAEGKCPATCEGAGGQWNGHWRTTRPGVMSVCGCCGSLCGLSTRYEEAGPIWDEQDARNKCPAVCARSDGGWNGRWRTTEPGRMSVCACVECG